MTELSRGANAPLQSTRLDLAVTGARPGSVDLMVFQLAGAARKVRSDADFVFFNQPASPEGAVRLSGPDRVAVDLGAVPAAVDVLAVAVALDDQVPGSLAGVPGLGVGVRGSADDYAAPALGLTTERAAVLVEIYRRQGAWKVRNVSAGWAAGLPALAREHGVVVDDGPPPAPPRDELPPPVLPIPPAAPPAAPAFGGLPPTPPVRPSGGRPPVPVGPGSPSAAWAPPVAPARPTPGGYPPSPVGHPSAPAAPARPTPGGYPPSPVGHPSAPAASYASATAPAPAGLPTPGGWPPPGGSWTPTRVTPPASVGGYPPPGSG